jgi:hypothetical protein
VRTRSLDAADRLAVAAFGWSLVMTALWFVLPAYHGEGASHTSGGEVRTFSSNETLLEHEGPGVLLVIAIPVVFTGLALLAHRSRRRRVIRIALGTVMALGCFLALLSVGAFYAPAAILLLVAGLRTDRSRAVVRA